MPTPKSRSMSRRVSRSRSSCSSWPMASGMARSHRGFAGPVQVLSASRRTGRPVAAWTGSRGRRRPGRRPAVRRACGRDWPAGAVPDRLEASVSPVARVSPGELGRPRPRRRCSASEGSRRAPRRRPADLRTRPVAAAATAVRRPFATPPRPVVFASGSSARPTRARRPRGSLESAPGRRSCPTIRREPGRLAAGQQREGPVTVFSETSASMATAQPNLCGRRGPSRSAVHS